MNKRPRGRPPKYPWQNIKPGEWFFAPGRTPTSIMNDARRRHKPKRFKSKTAIRSGVIGVKVWRIA